MADTNVVVSALLWPGPSRKLLDAARARRIEFFITATLLAELADVLARPKFERRLTDARVSAEELVHGYAALATLVVPAMIGPIVIDDPDDDAVLACALAAKAEVIVSGDSHLLRLESYEGIPILAPAQALAWISE